jgi:hypothetical protein
LHYKIKTKFLIMKSIQGQSIDPNGVVQNYVTATPTISGDNRFFAILRNTTNVDIVNPIVVLPCLLPVPLAGSQEIFSMGSVRTAEKNGNQNAGISIELPTGLTVADVNQLFINSAFSLKAMDISTNNVENWNQSLIIEDTRNILFGLPAQQARRGFQTSRIPIGNTYGETIPQYQLNLVKDNYIGLALERLKANSFVRFDFIIDARTMAVNLTAIQ